MSLISRHSLAGEIRELIGSTNASSSGVSYVRGAINQAAVMNSATITIPVQLRSVYSLSFWIRLKSNHTGSYRKFLEVPGVGTDRSPGFWFHSTTNKLHLRQSINGTNAGVDTTDELPIGQWVHLAFTCDVLLTDETRLTSWLNGDKQATSVVQGFPDYNDSPLTLLSGDYDIEDIRIYDHVLSQREVVDLNLGLLSRYRLIHNRYDVEQFGVMEINSGAFVDSDRGQVLSLGGSSAQIPLAMTPLDLKGETITFWQRCDVARDSVGGGSFSNRIVQWGTYYGANSGGFGLQSGNLSYYLKGPNSAGWTTSGSASDANALYDQGGWIHYAIVFTVDNRFQVLMNGEVYVDRVLSAPYTGLTSEGLSFGVGMQADLSDVQIHRKALSPTAINALYRQKLSVDNEGSAYVPRIVQKLKARYVRDWLNGSTSNNGKHWNEIRVLRDGVNLSLGKPITSSETAGRISKVTDGTTDNTNYAYVNAAAEAWVQIDLESIQEIDLVQVWHYYADGRTYYGTKTEVSEDGVNWIPIFDSAVEGTYAETDVGITHVASPRTTMVKQHGLYLPDVSEVGPAKNLFSWHPLNDTLNQYALGGEIYDFNAEIDRNGVRLNGTNAYFSLPELISPSETNRFTVSCLIKPESSGYILCPSSHGVDQMLSYNADNESVAIRVAEGSDLNNRAYASSPGSVPLNVWTHVVFSIDDVDLALYVKGTYEAGVIGTGPIGTWYGRWDIGRRANGTNYFGGRVRDLRVFNGIVSPTQVALLNHLITSNDLKSPAAASEFYVKRQIVEVMA